MSGISSFHIVAPISTTVAAAAISTTTLATGVTIAYVATPHVMLEFENTTGTQVFIGRTPITINGQGTTVAGTQVYFRPIPANSMRVSDLKTNGIAYGPAIYKVFAASTPASGELVMITTANK